MLGVRVPPGLPSFRASYQPVHPRTGEKMELNFRSKFEVVKQFLREVKTELKKVTWPTRKDTLSGTAVVLVAVFIIAFFLGIVDSGLSNLIKMLLKKAVG